MGDYVFMSEKPPIRSVQSTETSITLLDQSNAELCLAKHEGGGRNKREMGTAP